MSFPLIIFLSIIFIFVEYTFNCLCTVTALDPPNKPRAFLSALILRLLLLLPLNFTSDELISVALQLLGVPCTFFVIYFFYDKNLFRGFTRSMICDSAVGLFMFAEKQLVKMMTGKEINSPQLFSGDMVLPEFAVSLTESVIVGVISLFICYLMKKLFGKINIPQKVCAGVTIVYTVIVLIQIFSGIIRYNSYSFSFSPIEMLLYILLLVLSAVITKLVYDNYKKKLFMAENAHLEALVDMQYKHYTELESYYDNIRVMRHDIANHIHTMQVLLAEGHDEECREYLDNVVEQLNSVSVHYCENKTIDALLMLKHADAERAGVRFSADINASGSLDIKKSDIVCIMGNVIDNAIESAEKVSGGFVKISSDIKNNSFVMKCENSCGNDTDISADNTIRTTKTDQAAHGYGTKIIKTAVESYNGSVLYKNDNGIFTSIVIIPLNEKSSEHIK